MTRSLPEWIGKNDDEPIPPRVRLRVFIRFNGKCQECGLPINAAKRWICDHRTAIINGGENRESNLGPIHEVAMWNTRAPGPSEAIAPEAQETTSSDGGVESRHAVDPHPERTQGGLDGADGGIGPMHVIPRTIAGLAPGPSEAIAPEATKSALHWARPIGSDFETMRDWVWKSKLADLGDTILVWVNEGDFWNLAMLGGVQMKEYKNPEPLPTPRADAAQRGEAGPVAWIEYWRDADHDEMKSLLWRDEPRRDASTVSIEPLYAAPAQAAACREALEWIADFDWQWEGAGSEIRHRGRAGTVAARALGLPDKLPPGWPKPNESRSALASAPETREATANDLAAILNDYLSWTMSQVIANAILAKYDVRRRG